MLCSPFQLSPMMSWRGMKRVAGDSDCARAGPAHSRKPVHERRAVHSSKTRIEGGTLVILRCRASSRAMKKALATGRNHRPGKLLGSKIRQSRRGGSMEDTPGPDLALESTPDPADTRVLEERLHAFSVAATGIGDGEFFGIFLRGT